MSLGAQTHLVREGSNIVEFYRSFRLLTFRPNGAIALERGLCTRSGEPTRAVVARVRHILPPNWECGLRRARYSRTGQNLRFTYREGYHIDLDDILVFEPNGSISYGGYPMNIADIEDSVRERRDISPPATGDTPPAMPNWVGRMPVGSEASRQLRWMSPAPVEADPFRRSTALGDAEPVPATSYWYAANIAGLDLSAAPSATVSYTTAEVPVDLATGTATLPDGRVVQAPAGRRTVRYVVRGEITPPIPSITRAP